MRVFVKRGEDWIQMGDCNSVTNTDIERGYYTQSYFEPSHFTFSFNSTITELEPTSRAIALHTIQFPIQKMPNYDIPPEYNFLMGCYEHRITPVLIVTNEDDLMYLSDFTFRGEEHYS